MTNSFWTDAKRKIFDKIGEMPLKIHLNKAWQYAIGLFWLRGRAVKQLISNFSHLES